MAVTSRHPIIRWAVPAAAVLAIGAAVAAPRAVADPALPPKTAEELLVDLRNADVSAFSGTVETRSELGLPALPVGDSEFAQLMSGSHTIRVWQSKEHKSRVSVLGDAAETTVVRNGADVWQWSSASKTAKHTVLTERQRPAATPPTATPVPSTPQEAAREALAQIEPTTAVTVSQTARVAGRPAYELVLDPKSSDTLVAKVAIAMDSETKAPLRVEVWPVGANQPAIRVGFTQVSFTAPDDSVFAFTPPAGATIEEVQPKEHGDRPNADRPEAAKPEMPKPVTVGDGWDRVTVATMPTKPATPGAQQPSEQAPAGEEHQRAAAEWQRTLESLPTVQGSWGQGRVLTSALVTVVLTEDGRVAFGMVPTDRVVAAIPR